MIVKQAVESIGQTVTFWDHTAGEYKQGTLIEVHEADYIGVIDVGTKHEADVVDIHLGTIEEVTMQEEDDDVWDGLLASGDLERDVPIDLEDDVDIGQYEDSLDDDSEF